MTIGVLAERAGVRPSAIRYYERLGLLPAPLRQSGRRSYDPDAVAQLAVIQFALVTGCSLRETKRLVRGFLKDAPAGARWQDLANAKMKDLDVVIARANAMKALLQRISTNCECSDLVECGRRLACNRARWARS
jgi:MerR family redox-sensitive transcriptional activator SoxR